MNQNTNPAINKTLRAVSKLKRHGQKNVLIAKVKSIVIDHTIEFNEQPSSNSAGEANYFYSCSATLLVTHVEQFLKKRANFDQLNKCHSFQKYYNICIVLCGYDYKMFRDGPLKK